MKFGLVCMCAPTERIGYDTCASAAMVSLAWIGSRVVGADRSAYGDGAQVFDFTRE